MPQFQHNICICERPMALVQCRDCQYISKGRMRRECKMHPKVVFLLDITVCSFCKRKNLVEVNPAPAVQFDSGLDDSFSTNSAG